MTTNDGSSSDRHLSNLTTNTEALDYSEVPLDVVYDQDDVDDEPSQHERLARKWKPISSEIDIHFILCSGKSQRTNRFELRFRTEAENGLDRKSVV